MNIKIEQNSDCCGEIELLKEWLKQSPHYTSYPKNSFSNADVVAIAVNELYDKIVEERKNGIIKKIF